MPKADATIKKMVFKEDTDSGKIAIGMGRGRKNHSHAENKLLVFCSKKTTYCRGLWKSYARKAGYAYFEMNFNKPIYSVLYSVGFWSNSENLDGTAALKIKDSNGNWTQMTNLLSLQLNARGQGLKRYSNYFPNGIYGLKFECTATATGSRNMGRLSIDDIVFGMKAGSNDNNYYITNYRKTVA